MCYKCGDTFTARPGRPKHLCPNTESHSTSHTRTRLQGDSRINQVLDHTLAREGEYTRMQHITTQCEVTFREVLHLNTLQGEVPESSGERAKQQAYNFNKDIQKKVRSSVREAEQKKQVEHAKSLTVQGRFLALAALEQEDIVWKSNMFDLKSGTLKFLLNSSIDTLPTPANLKRWKKSQSDLCKLCRCRGTTNHILNGCKSSLDNGKYLWRHNNIVNYIVSNIDTDKFTVFSDIPGFEAPGGGTIPPHICITNLKPDIVILDETQKNIHIFELTCPSGPENIEKRHKEKSDKYATFLTDCTGYKCSVTCFEVSSKGYLTTRNHNHLNDLHKFIQKETKRSSFKENVSSLSVYSSYQLWVLRSEDVFVAPPFLIPHSRGQGGQGDKRQNSCSAGQQ